VELEVEVTAIHAPEVASAADKGAPVPTLDPERDLREGNWLDDGGQN
jgi:hypothetical protein